MPQHPKPTIATVKQYTRSSPRAIHPDELEPLLLTLVTVDATLVRHGRVDLARQLRREIARLIDQ